MRFIPKKKLLTETDANPLEINKIDLSYDKQYVEAILKAVASESGAIVEYEQILAIEPKINDKKLIDLFHDTLIDIKNEEVKHLAQLNEKISQTSNLKDSYEDGTEEAKSGKDKDNETEKDTGNKEEVTESKKLQTESIDLNENLPNDRTYAYDPDEIVDLISSKYVLTFDQAKDIFNLLNPNELDELSAEELDTGIAKVVSKYKFTPEEKEELEQLIITHAHDPKGDRREEWKTDIGLDISALEDTLENVTTYAAKERINHLIEELKKIEYDGSSDIAWNIEQYNGDKHKGIIS